VALERREDEGEQNRARPQAVEKKKAGFGPANQPCAMVYLRYGLFVMVYF
jgi:hypothetical protein